MELNKPLKDQELSSLAERLPPTEFDKIATEHLGLTKVGLAQCKESAGRNCVTYMTKSLLMWRDLQPQNEARQLLHSKLLEAANQGLLSRNSFRFLVDADHDIKLSRWEVCAKNLGKMKMKCKSYPTLILTTVAIIPMLDDFINWSHSISLDKMTTTFITIHDMKFPAASNMEDLGILILTICGCLMEVSGVLGCCLWWNASKPGTQRPTKRKVDLCRFSFVMLMAALLFITVCSRLYLYLDLRHYNVEEGKLEILMKDTMKHYPYDPDVAKSWTKLQIGYECCGIQNHTDWYQTLNNRVPDSCCKTFKTNCSQNHLTSENIYENGCLQNLTFHINEQVRYQTTDWQTTCLAIVVCLVLCLIKTMMYSRKEFCRPCLCCTRTKKYNLLETGETEAVPYLDDVEAGGDDLHSDLADDTDELQYDDSDLRLLMTDTESLNVPTGVLNIEYSDDERLLDLD